MLVSPKTKIFLMVRESYFRFKVRKPGGQFTPKRRWMTLQEALERYGEGNFKILKHTQIGEDRELISIRDVLRLTRR